MMGIESQGMLLLAENPDGSLRLMHPELKLLMDQLLFNYIYSYSY